MITPWGLNHLELCCLAPDGGGGGGMSTGGMSTGDKAPPAGDGGDPAKTETGEDKPEGDKGKEAKTFTQAELDAILNKKFAEWQKKQETAVNTARSEGKTEGEKLAKMTAEEKAQHDREQAEATLRTREAEITRRELRAQALETLAEKDLHKGLADVLDYTDADKCNASITKLETAIRIAVDARMEKHLKGKTPQSGEAAGAKPVTLGESVAAYYKK